MDVNKLPRSTVYYASSTQEGNNDNIQNSQNHTQLAKNLIFDSNHQFSQEDILHPNGRFPCYYCPNRPINTPLYFIPSHQVNEHQIMMFPMTHCHNSCVLGSINNMPNNWQIRRLFEQLYPGTVVPPPRCCFHINPPMTLEQYFEHIGSRKTTIYEDPDVRTFFATLYFSRVNGNVNDIPISNFSSQYGQPDANAADIGQRVERPTTTMKTSYLDEGHMTHLGKVFPIYETL